MTISFLSEVYKIVRFKEKTDKANVVLINNLLDQLNTELEYIT